MMNCALCQGPAILCNSHIIPEFLYKTLYDPIHRFKLISIDPVTPNALLQKGLREPLLCQSCEGQFSLAERYASMFLNGGVAVDIRQQDDRLYLSGLDYKQLKLFQMSVLWRAGVSSLPEFSQVALGSHEEKLRRMLAADEPGLPETYGCIMSLLVDRGELVQGLIVPPTWARLDGQMAYRFVFGGLAFIFVVSSSRLPRYLSDTFLQRSGTATVKLQQVNELGFLRETFAKMDRLGKFD